MRRVAISERRRPAPNTRDPALTTATAERPFTLKRLKTYLRSAMGENRLTSLALLNIHAETTSVDAQEVISHRQVCVVWPTQAELYALTLD